MRIVVLCGRANVGKTETLKQLVAECHERGAQLIGEPLSIDGNDIVEVFSYNGLRVCVSTGGDAVEGGVEKAYEVARHSSCDVFVTASRASQNCETIEYVKKLGDYPIFLSAYAESGKDEKGQNLQDLAKRARIDALLRCI